MGSTCGASGPGASVPRGEHVTMAFPHCPGHGMSPVWGRVGSPAPQRDSVLSINIPAVVFKGYVCASAQR